MPGTIGNKNAWKGDDVGYDGIHRWLRRTFGKANKCENPKCVYPRNSTHRPIKIILKPARFEWALIKGKSYERKRENYIMLCKSCHSYYDFTEERRKNLRKSHLGILKGYTPWNKGKKYHHKPKELSGEFLISPLFKC